MIAAAIGIPMSSSAARAAGGDLRKRLCLLVDGQFFRAGGFGRAAGRLNAHYADDPGSKFYTPLRSLRPVLHQGDRGDGKRGSACP